MATVGSTHVSNVPTIMPNRITNHRIYFLFDLTRPISG